MYVIDVITAIDGVSFEEAWAAKVETKFADLPRVFYLENI